MEEQRETIAKQVLDEIKRYDQNKALLSYSKNSRAKMTRYRWRDTEDDEIRKMASQS